MQHFYLTWFQPDGDDLVGEELLDVSEDMIRKWFWIRPNDPQLDGLVVQASQRKQLQEHIHHQIDLNSFDYIIDHCVV